MALTEQTIVDKIEVVGEIIQVRRATQILRDGQVVSQTYHRNSYMQGQDISQEDPRVQAVAQAAWLGVAPMQLPPMTPSRQTVPVEFARLFTRPERIAIRTAAEASPALKDFHELLSLSFAIDLDHPEVVAGMNALVAAGLITADRKTRILSNQSPE